MCVKEHSKNFVDKNDISYSALHELLRENTSNLWISLDEFEAFLLEKGALKHSKLESLLLRLGFTINKKDRTGKHNEMYQFHKTQKTVIWKFSTQHEMNTEFVDDSQVARSSILGYGEEDTLESIDMHVVFKRTFPRINDVFTKHFDSVSSSNSRIEADFSIASFLAL